MKKRALISVAAVILLAFLGWYAWAPPHTPAEQPQMVILSRENIQQFRSDFNREPASARLVLLVSPT